MLPWKSYPRALSLDLSEQSLLATTLAMGCPWYLHFAPEVRALFVLYSKHMDSRFHHQLVSGLGIGVELSGNEMGTQMVVQ
jgi:hypothetical protein